MRIYVSGPMSGFTTKEYTKAFGDAAKRLRKGGHTVVNPAELDKKGPPLTSWADYLRRDIKVLVDCDAIRLLDGWENSEGAKLEAHIAEKLGLARVDADGYRIHPVAMVTVPPPKQSILLEADVLVNGPRQRDYGHPISDFTRTGKIWGAILGTDPVPPDKVGLCMVGLKLSREVNRPKTDNRRDGAGYWGTVDLVMEALGKKDPS